ncbi:MAG: OmpH family outer membrane protein [Myxococcales bacterium FL481]|nr:MAG: OmpH family outer membrane protein [Myxococcales bacterium FL481]
MMHSARPGPTGPVRMSSLGRWLGIAALLGTFVTAAGTPATGLAAVPEVKKIAMVDLQRVLNETKHGKKARSELEASSKVKQDKLDKKRTKLEAEQAKLSSLSGEALARAQEKLQRDMMEWQSMYMALQQELAQQEGRLVEQIYTNCQGLVNELAKELSLDLVLVRDNMTVIYARDGQDITKKLIDRYDRKHAG